MRVGQLWRRRPRILCRQKWYFDQLTRYEREAKEKRLTVKDWALSVLDRQGAAPEQIE
jgi:hypothetical protein